MKYPYVEAALIAGAIVILACIFGPGIKAAHGAEVTPLVSNPRKGECYSAPQILEGLAKYKGMHVQAEWKGTRGATSYFVVGNVRNSYVLVQRGPDLCVLSEIKAFFPRDGLPI